MIQYIPTDADRARFPDSYVREARYLGYGKDRHRITVESGNAEEFFA